MFCRCFRRDDDDYTPDETPKTPKTPKSARTPNNRINLPKEFPMYVISTDDFLDLSEMRPHQELLTERIVQVYQPNLDPVTFVSHEWSGLQHPDPKKKQLLALQKALRGFREQSLKLIYDPVALVRRFQKNVAYWELQEMAKGWLWIDFMCIPQGCACKTAEEREEQENQLRDAIRSLHTYVAHCSFFLILAPAQHHELGRLMDYTSWKSRGWCQFELTVNVLMGGHAPVIMVQGLGSVKKVSPRIFLHFAPCLAEFTKDEDKLFISDALDQVINAQVARLRSCGEVHRLQMLECLRALLTRRTGDLTLFKRLSRTGSLAYMASRKLCVTYKGWTQLHYAAARSDKEAVTRLLAICEQVEAQTRQADKDLFLGSSLTPLHLWAAFSFTEEIARLLVSNKAQVDRRASEGLTPLMMACRTGNINACRTLLEMEADPNAEDCMGCRPLTFALANDAEHLVSPLLNARADVSYRWAGLSALHFLGLTSSANSLERLLGEGLDINTVGPLRCWRPRRWATPRWWRRCRVPELTWLLGTRQALTSMRFVASAASRSRFFQSTRRRIPMRHIHMLHGLHSLNEVFACRYALATDASLVEISVPEITRVWCWCLHPVTTVPPKKLWMMKDEKCGAWRGKFAMDLGNCVASANPGIWDSDSTRNGSEVSSPERLDGANPSSMLIHATVAAPSLPRRCTLGPPCCARSGSVLEVKPPGSHHLWHASSVGLPEFFLRRATASSGQQQGLTRNIPYDLEVWANDVRGHAYSRACMEPYTVSTVRHFGKGVESPDGWSAHFISTSGLKSSGVPNQDAYSFTTLQCGWILCIACDGHGEHGEIIAERVSRALPLFFSSYLVHGTEEALRRAFQSAQNDLESSFGPMQVYSGATVVMCCIDKDAESVWCAHVGDSRLVVGDMDTGQPVFCSTEHKAHDAEEYKRLEAAGAQVIQKRYDDGEVVSRIFIPKTGVPGLAMSRSMGDGCLKKYGVTAEPDISNITDSWNSCALPGMIMGSDGLWVHGNVASARTTDWVVQCTAANCLFRVLLKCLPYAMTSIDWPVHNVQSDEWLIFLLTTGLAFAFLAFLLLLTARSGSRGGAGSAALRGAPVQLLGTRREQKKLRRLVLPDDCVERVETSVVERPQERLKDAKEASNEKLEEENLQSLLQRRAGMDWNCLVVQTKHLGAKAYVQTKHLAAKAYDTLNEGMVSMTKSKPEAWWNAYQVNQEKLADVDLKPVVVFVNTRSGGQQGVKVLNELQAYLHCAQLVDLQRGGPEAALGWWDKTTLQYRILVCGGDGTVGWVLGALEQLDFTYKPPLAVLPLGTGNDLARTFGWGGGYTGSSILPVLQQVGRAHVELLDRWTVTWPTGSELHSSYGCAKRGSLDDRRPSFLPGGQPPQPRERKTLTMSNYFGIGVDAAVALDFHQMRERRPDWFWSRLVNKLWYFRTAEC
eukprot:s393_g29.t1